MAQSSDSMSVGKAAWSIGLSAMAGTLLMLGGAFQFFEGLAALINNNFYVKTPNNVFAFNVTTWGWIHLLIGIVMMITGLALLSGQTWARVIGIIIVSISAITNFMFIPTYPLWSIIIIIVDIAVIWALTVYRRALA